MVIAKAVRIAVVIQDWRLKNASFYIFFSTNSVQNSFGAGRYVARQAQGASRNGGGFSVLPFKILVKNRMSRQILTLALQILCKSR
jgi:hypothetical protein